jgi:protein CpxP
MKKLGRIQKLGLAGLSALALAAPVALAQTAGGEQSGQAQRAERGEHRGHRGGKRGGRGEFGGRGGRFGGGLRGVELTDAQKASLKQLRQSFGERTKSLRDQLRAKREEVRQAESGTTFNEQLAAQKLAEASGLQAKLMAEEFKLRQDSLALLTAEQRTQLERRRQQREQRRAERKAARQARRQTQQQ